MKRNTLYLMLLFNVNMHTDFWTSRDDLQCWPGTTFSVLSVLRLNVPSIAEKAGDCLYSKTHLWEGVLDCNLPRLGSCRSRSLTQEAGCPPRSTKSKVVPA